MRAGSLDREITIGRIVNAPNPTEPWIPGEPTWIEVAAVRAQLFQADTEEFIRTFGEAQVATVIFRIRYVDGVQLTDQVIYGNTLYDLKEVKEIGRRKGLELRTVAAT